MMIVPDNLTMESLDPEKALTEVDPSAVSISINDNLSRGDEKKEEDEACVPNQHPEEAPVFYRSLVVDSGAIIKTSSHFSTGFGNPLLKTAKSFYTCQSVLDEIKDSRSKSVLETLPFDIVVREPAPESLRAVAAFARQTGDYPSLSHVDIKVLALQYELENEGCGSVDHLRKEPKRKLGLGKIQPLDKNANSETNNKAENTPPKSSSAQCNPDHNEPDENSEHDNSEQNNPEHNNSEQNNSEQNNSEHNNSEKNNSEQNNPEHNNSEQNNSEQNNPEHNNSEQNNYEHNNSEQNNPEQNNPEQNNPEQNNPEQNNSEQTPEQINTDKISTDKCACEQNVLNKKTETHKPVFTWASAVSSSTGKAVAKSFLKDDAQEELKGSLSNKDVISNDDVIRNEDVKGSLSKQEPPKRIYNSFGKYRDLISPQGAGNVKQRAAQAHLRKLTEQQTSLLSSTSNDTGIATGPATLGKSRILGAGDLAVQSDQVEEDDGEGWVTVSNLATIKATGASCFGSTNLNQNNVAPAVQPNGPSPDLRCACATTDFAMQNVILQMGMKLVSVDGRTVRRVKQWVTRCSACFTIYSGNDGSAIGSNTKLTSRLFCSKCGSDTLERVSASVDANSGRYKLYMSQRHKKSTRGTIYSLPKPGKGNRFEGDLLLREDQLLMGAWNQKVRKGGPKAESMFGSDISDMVGLGDLTKRNDIQVGFGRRNPNSSKFGRERRGKKKTKAAETNKACGLRRY